MIVHTILLSLLLSAGHAGVTAQDTAKSDPFPIYSVKRLEGSIAIDGNWNKKAWQNVNPVLITHDIINVPAFHVVTEVKMCYDTSNLYVIFLVHDRGVRSLTTQIGGPVWKDAAVEFFFCTDTARPDRYFNLEINCGGTPLLGYNSVRPSAQDIRLIEIAHSMPPVVDPEVAGPIDWTIEYRIPLAMLAKFGDITKPARGVSWKANFCKIAENNTNPHHMTWSPITDPHPNFHMPQFFGRLQFE
jgi:Carbohydrate-binding family 9